MAEQIIVGAEKFRAQIQPPKGKILSEDHELLKMISNHFDDDDNFFHITCHLDSVPKAKIQWGEYIDLERLLPRDRAGGGGPIQFQEDSKVELVSQGGHTYFKPVCESQINGLRKWEQAFRVYAAVYTDSHPDHCSEIWQYVHTINVVASSYQWHNVSYYDMTFRQLMAYKPQCSWSKIYHQGWNLAMRDPLGNMKPQQPFGNGQQTSTHQPKQHDWHDDCCWKFNRNRCKDSKDCRYDHRCTYCGGWNHGYFNCRKRLRKNGGRKGRNSSPHKK